MMGAKGSRTAISFSKVSFMVHCDLEEGSKNHFQSTLLVERERVTQKYSVYALDDIDNYGRPLSMVSVSLLVKYPGP